MGFSVCLIQWVMFLTVSIPPSLPRNQMCLPQVQGGLTEMSLECWAVWNFTDYNSPVVYPVVYVLSLPTIKYRSYYFIETDLHLWPLSACKQPSLWLLMLSIS